MVNVVKPDQDRSLDRPCEVGRRGKFVKIKCVRCGNHQVVFGKSSTRVKCLKCNKLLVRVSGGKVRIRTMVKEILR